tara:strand:- start:169 stop:480 length:312 start_codon:yes stop_codon:yes gene_type:complete
MNIYTGDGANHFLKLFFVILFFITNSNSFSSEMPDSSYQQKVPVLLHKPPKVMFDDRPTLLQLFVTIHDDSIKTVSIFYKTNEMSMFQEIELNKRKRILYFQI